MEKYLFFVIFFIVVFTSVAQNDSIRIILEEVAIVADRKLKKNSQGYKIRTLDNSIITKNIKSFTSLLRFNSPIYFKEYGAGGTSSASFRGTSSHNTAVIWNGININSVNSGQTGFNSLSVSLIDAIDIRSGGGSIEYGSGAVGGTIHLNDELFYNSKRTIQSQLVIDAGSFDTYNSLYKLKFSDKRIAFKFGVSYNESENDYKLLDTDYKNFNGAYHNSNVNVGLVYKITPFSELKLYSTNYSGVRLFSGELPNPTSANDKYKNFNYRNLLVYNYHKEKFNHELKLAFLTQEYQYFDDKTSKDFNFGKSKRYLIKYILGYKFPKLNSTLTSYSEYQSVFGKTDRIVEKNRRQFSQSFIYNQKLYGKVFFDAKIRKDINSDYNVPYSFALGVNAKPFRTLSFRANGSKNYRVPTYNDLYWPGQGNINLVPETALQGEFGTVFKNNQLAIDIAVFYISTKNKIVWTPNGDPNRAGVWTPINLSNVENKGVELTLDYKNNYKKHFVNFNLNYSYIEAKDKETHKFLTFVPKYLFNGSLGYSYKRFSFLYQQLFTGEIFTTESNSKDFIISSFLVRNIGGDFKIIQKKKHQMSIGFKVNNVSNEKYVTQPRRPMPNRNFNFNINYKF